MENATRAAGYDVDKLAADIAAAQREGKSAAAVQTLHKQFQGLQAATATHSDLLSSSLEDTADEARTSPAREPAFQAEE